jgi:hypothetical protein
MISPADMFSRIVAAVPAFAAVLAEHLADNEELLPHVLMADCGRFLASHFVGTGEAVGGVPSEDDVCGVLSVLNTAMASGDDDTRNVIAVSFLEYLWMEPHYAVMSPLLGSALRAEIKRQKRWYAKST